MASEKDMKMLADISRMYYDEGMKQVDIAVKFSISRSLVSKYLTKARELGIVEIIIHDDHFHPFRNLEKKLKKRFGYTDVIIIETQEEKKFQKIRLGDAAAQYFKKKLKNNDIVAVSPGTSVHHMATSSSLFSNFPDVTFVPLTGGLSHQHYDIQSNVVSHIFADRIGAKKIELHAPITVDTVEAKEMMMNQPFIKNAFTVAKNADIAIIGIGGAPVYSTMTKTYLIGEDNKDEYYHPDIVGDLCYNFINKDGKLVECAWNERVISLDLDSLRNIPMIICVAEGLEKVDAIHAASINNLVDVLATDSKTAEALLMKE